jgi:AmiR/NasT family two-component response regulator
LPTLPIAAPAQLVKQACQIIAANERPCIVAQLVEYKEKDGVEAKLKLPSKGEVVAALHEACGREVLLVTSGEEEFRARLRRRKSKDQPELRHRRRIRRRCLNDAAGVP